MILVTGGAGFIGSNFIRQWIENEKTPVLNLDLLTYAGNLSNVEDLSNDPLYEFVKGDIGDRAMVRALLREKKPSAIIHFAAETHVDRSIHDPSVFVQTNVLGTFNLLDEAYHYWKEQDEPAKKKFRFLHVSTDEVFGSLTSEAPSSKEGSTYSPNSPYSASKASADHLVRSYYKTYHFPILITTCTNNFGPYQHPEKLIPLALLKAVSGKNIPLYGDGLNLRDWLYVVDHCEAIRTVLIKGVPGESYNVGAGNDKTNFEVLQALCDILDNRFPDKPAHHNFITHVKDRPGHDRRYSLDTTKIRRDLGWAPKKDFEKALEETVDWYLNHLDWLQKVAGKEFQEWIKKQYYPKEIV